MKKILIVLAGLLAAAGVLSFSVIAGFADQETSESSTTETSIEDQFTQELYARLSPEQLSQLQEYMTMDPAETLFLRAKQIAEPVKEQAEGETIGPE